MGNVEILSSDGKAISVLQWRSYDFWRLGRVITVVTLNRNYELKNALLLNKFPFIWRSNLKFVDHGSIFLNIKYRQLFRPRSTTGPRLPQRKVSLEKLIVAQVAK